MMVIFFCLLLLYNLQPTDLTGSEVVVRSHTCNFEPPGGACGWTVPHSSRITSAHNVPESGPTVDTNPGNSNGHYLYYFTNQSISSSEQALIFPSHQFVCGLSFSYFIAGPLDLDIVRENLGVDTVFISQGLTPTSSPESWDSANYRYNATILETPSSGSSLYFDVSRYELGEAPLESDDAELFLALDNVTLTFCLPCDYDALVEPDAIFVGGPERIDIQLRRLTTYQFNASTPACPNETLIFTIESVVPDFLAPIFSLNAATGELSVDASGPHLDANGTSGYLNVSVHVLNSNYTQVTSPHLELLTIPFTQPPTITHTAPPLLSFDITSSFVYIFETTSTLGQTLSYGQLQATPAELSADANITVLEHNIGARVMGRVSIDTTLPVIIEQGITPFLSVTITDGFGGMVVATTQLRFNPSPPLFERPLYDFDIAEVTSTGMLLGPIRLIDPNGGLNLLTPTIEPNVEGTSTFFSIIAADFTAGLDQMHAYFSYNLVVRRQIDYEHMQAVDFQLVAVDVDDQSLSSTAAVRIDVLPINEFTPHFVDSSKEAFISENEPTSSLVEIFLAHDQDSGPDGLVRYSITEGNSDGYFTISGAGVGFGEVLVKTTPINPGIYTLTITASDHGVPPRSSNAILVVHVAATRDIDCTADNYGPPHVDSSSPTTLVVPVEGNMTLYCMYTADPAVRGYKWTHNTQTLLAGEADPHYNISMDSLSIGSLLSSDGGLYYCNVTNQCGVGIYPFIVHIIDYPNPPTNVRVTATPSPRSLVLAWTIPLGGTVPVTNSLNTPVTSYTIQVLNRGLDQSYQDVLTVPDVSMTTATVTGLHPGAQYGVRVLAQNLAGDTPSEVVNITTNSSVPSIDYLRATGLQNNSILVEWELEYTGGHPIILFEIHVMRDLPRGRSRRDTPPPDLVYHTDASAGRLVTMAVDTGHTYSVRSTATNVLGPSNDQIDNVFVGYSDIRSCNFEGSGAEGCGWNLGEGVVTRADAATPPLPMTDASSNAQGHYVYLEVARASEGTVVSYPRAGYSCGLTFSYYLTEGGGGVSLVLRASSGTVLWSSPSGAAAVWEVVGLTNSQYLTTQVDEGVEFVLVSAGTNVSVALDDVTINFCLPCDFGSLGSNAMFDLSYENYSRIYLRTPQTMQIQAVVEDCPNAVLNFSVRRVIPTSLQPSFSLDTQDGRNVTLRVEPISPSRVEPNSLGFLQVEISILNSDYLSPDVTVSKTAAIEFLLVQLAENCSFTRRCEGEPCTGWRVGGGVRTTQQSQPALEDTFTGSYLYTDSNDAELTMVMSVINDDFCGVSFAYGVSTGTEMLITVDGLDDIWSSMSVPAVSGWNNLTVQIDLQDVQVVSNRSILFVARLASSASSYAALDNITLHPCIDCETPVCTLTSCVPGHYYSLDHASCMDCPPGYYCPDWRIFPKPCPSGTFSDSSAADSADTCRTCPPNSFAIQVASTSCQSCPVGFDCSNASSLPVLTGEANCPTTATKFPVVTVSLGVAVGILLFACVFMLCMSAWCYRRRQQSQKRARDKRILLAGSHSSDSVGLNLSMVRDGKHLKGKANRGGNSVRTMTSFLSDDDNVNYFENDTWMEAEELTTPNGRGGGNSLVFRNTNYEGEDEQEQIEMSHHKGKPNATQRTSNF